MQKTIYCCDICGKEIKEYDSLTDCILLPVGEAGQHHKTVAIEKRDICLHCLVTTIVIEYKVAGYVASTELINLIDKRAKEVQK